MGVLEISRISNKSLSRRNLLVHPAEPPMEILCRDPANSIFVGKTKMLHVPFFWSYENVTNPHIAVVGISGSGKSYFIKTFLIRASITWNSNAVIIDWAGEYKDWVRDIGGEILALGKGSYINLLDLGGMKPYNRIKQVMRTLELLTDIGNYPEQKRLTEEAIEKAYIRDKFQMDAVEQKDELGKPLKPPTLKNVVKILEEKASMGTYEFPAELENAIYRLKKFTKPGEDYFARKSTIDLEKLITSGVVDIDLSGLPDERARALGALTILQFIKEKMRATGWAKTKGLRLLVVLDEAWKISKEENSDAVMIVREGRKYNFGMIIASQNPTDISEAIFSNVGTTFILKVKFEKYLDYLQGTLNFSEFMRHEISTLGVGQTAVNMAFTTPTPYPSTFLIDKIVGEEPSVEYFLLLESVLTDKQKKDDTMAKSIAFDKGEFRRKLIEYGLSEENIVNMLGLFDRNNRRMGIIAFVLLLERTGLERKRIADFLQEMGIEDSVMINIFVNVDKKRSKFEGRDISQLVLED
ncbi:ATP-binding protein [Candidatus Micrarchaeota archaeon]|nr:ATP-binding protein [Candidatus Micrarchaeota archaeon]